jgi:hypothetical protein
MYTHTMLFFWRGAESFCHDCTPPKEYPCSAGARLEVGWHKTALDLLLPQFADSFKMRIAHGADLE